VKLGTIITGIRGTIGGATFSRNKSGTYVKPWAQGSNPRTERQTLHRSLFATIPSNWRALSDAQRAAWDIFALLPAQQQTDPFGQTYYLSGYQWYMRCNTRLLQAGRSLITAPPSAGYPAAPTLSTWTPHSTATGNTHFDTPANEFSTVDGLLFVSLAQSYGRTVPSAPFAFAKIFQNDASTFHGFQTELELLFGTVSVGQVLFGQCFAQSYEGLRSTVTAKRGKITS